MENGRKMVLGGALKPLLEMAKSGDATCETEAVTALGNLALSQDNQTQFIKEGGMAAIEVMTLSRNPRVQHMVGAVCCGAEDNQSGAGLGVLGSQVRSLRVWRQCGLGSRVGYVARDARCTWVTVRVASVRTGITGRVCSPGRKVHAGDCACGVSADWDHG